MLSELKNEADRTFTENGAVAHRSSGSHCLNLFAACGALRQAPDGVQYSLFTRAWAENPDLAMKILFYARDIREGLGERELFREILSWLAFRQPDSVRKNIPLVAEYGRWDDLLALLGTRCEKDAVACIRKQLAKDTEALRHGGSVSLLGKWLPSVHTASAERRAQAGALCRALHMTEKEYRKTLSALRSHLDIVEKRLCASDYTFDYGAVPSGAMLKYQQAFLRNDAERYNAFISQVQEGTAALHADTLYPYQIVRKCIRIADGETDPETDLPGLVRALDASWKSLPDYCNGRNALAVVDGSGSMYTGGNLQPAEIALSLGIYFAEHNTGFFRNHFITFSRTPQLVEIQGKDIAEKAAFCMSFNEAANTNLCGVFALLLKTAVDHRLPQEELPETVYIISDMEFDAGVDCDRALFDEIRDLYRQYGYLLPTLVYWNVCFRNEQFPVSSGDEGAVLVSGASPVLFNMVIRGGLSPEEFMLSVIESERYLPVKA